MRSIYRQHVLEVNTDPNTSQIIYDVYNRSNQHLLAGFSQQNVGERVIAERLRAKVDQMILERPVDLRDFNTIRH